MGTALGICLFLMTHLHAATSSISTSTIAALDSSLSSSDAANTSSSLFNEDEELAKIAATCLTIREHEQLAGDLFRNYYARMHNTHLFSVAEEIIGLTELRSVLGFSPPGPWTKFNYSQPSEGDLAAATTIDEYFDLREPRSEDRSLDSYFFFEKNFTPVIAFLDKRFPAVRKMFRRKFEEILRSLDAEGGTMDRKTVDHMIDEYKAICIKVDNVTSKLGIRTSECMMASRNLQG